jgi:hypothetical protein
MKGIVKYHGLKQLMAKYGLNIGDIAKVIKKSYRQTIKKINQDVSPSGVMSTFDINEAYSVVKFFREKGENVSVEGIFFANEVSNETKSA